MFLTSVFYFNIASIISDDNLVHKPKVLSFRNEKDKQNQGLMTHHRAGVGIDDLPPAFGAKLLELFIKI